jgi:hypothetical protein
VQRRWGGRSRGAGAVALGVGLALASLLALGGCTSSGTPATTTTTTSTVTHTRTPAGTTFRPAPAATVRPLPYGAHPHKGEKDHACPYIHAGLNVDAGHGVNLADLEGDRVYRTTLLTELHPVGCRFYFYAPPYEAIADIRPRTFGTAVEAFDAMILTARTGHELITEKNFAKGATGICFRTKYFAPDGNRDWAFVFAKGKTMVAVYTQRSDTSRNALYIARAIAGKF